MKNKKIRHREKDNISGKASYSEDIKNSYKSI